ncbi:iron ABC transporter permease [Leucobacter sp. 7(1)]|uniref:FecCD family ABC transporter permease n=1 Tax=Leucobacter sp. 7(1) TaxID=1255613 RepID=UPI000B3541E8|nr:iron ABC transporter permease [Leucobacter sp. 7(1)]
MPSHERPTSPAGTGRTGALRRLPFGVIIVGLLLALIAVSVMGVGLGAVRVDPARTLQVIGERLSGGDPSGPDAFIVWELRVPRVLQAIIVGAALAVAGACVQVLVLNPIADPYVLGLSSGASVGAVLVVTTVGVATAGGLLLPAAAFLGAAAAGAAVAATATSRRSLSAGCLVLSGVAIGQLLGGLVSFLLIRAGDSDATQQVVFWLLGSLAGSQWRLVAVVAPVVTVAIALSVVCASRLDLLSLGDAQAAASGLRPGRARFVVFALTALLTGAAVAVSGTIGFVGLIVLSCLTRVG